MVPSYPQWRRPQVQKFLLRGREESLLLRLGKWKMRDRGKPLQQSSSIPLLLENQPRSANLMGLEGNIDFDAVGYLDEWDPAVHAKFLAVKSHGALNMAVARSLALGVKCQGQRFGLGHAPDGESALHIKSNRTGLNNFGGVKRDVGVVFGIEEVFALQFGVLHVASGIH